MSGYCGPRVCNIADLVTLRSRPRVSLRFCPRQERKDTVLQAMEARARTVLEARARAGETVKRRRLAARDGAPADAAPCFAPVRVMLRAVRATCSRKRQREKGLDQR